MADLTEQQKQFVIRCWACDMESKDIADSFVENFSTEETVAVRPTSSQLARYNPRNESCSLSPAHLKIFNKAQKTFREDLSTIPAFHRAYRVRELNILYLQLKKKSAVLAQAVLKQIAQENGGLFEQRQVAGSPSEIAAYIQAVATTLRGAVDRNVSDPEERKRVHADIQEILEAAN